jgi:hypothetical protein
VIAGNCYCIIDFQIYATKNSIKISPVLMTVLSCGTKDLRQVPFYAYPAVIYVSCEPIIRCGQCYTCLHLLFCIVTASPQSRHPNNNNGELCHLQALLQSHLCRSCIAPTANLKTITVCWLRTITTVSTDVLYALVGGTMDFEYQYLPCGSTSVVESVQIHTECSRADCKCFEHHGTDRITYQRTDKAFAIRHSMMVRLTLICKTAVVTWHRKQSFRLCRMTPSRHRSHPARTGCLSTNVLIRRAWPNSRRYHSDRS